VAVVGAASGGRMVEDTGDSAESTISSSGVSCSLRIRVEVVEFNVRNNINAISIMALRGIVVKRVSKCAMLVGV